jgi:hypothetical protein
MKKLVGKVNVNQFKFYFFSWSYFYFYSAGYLFYKKIKNYLSNENKKVLCICIY